MKLNSAKLILLFYSLLVLNVFGQDAILQENKTLKNSKFSFNYPADWRMVDKSSEEVQQYNFTPPTGNVLIMIISYDALIPDYDLFNQLRVLTSKKLADKLYAGFNKSGSGKRDDACTVVENITVPGKRITGLFDNVPTSADIYYFALNKKFFNFIYLREDRESSKTDIVWKNILDTFSFKDLNPKKPDFLIDTGSDAVLNGKAIKLIRPNLPANSFSMRGEYEVKVRVTIDENGKVISAKSINYPSYAPYIEKAAKDSKFEPSLICGKPSKVSGIIVYDFTIF